MPKSDLARVRITRSRRAGLTFSPARCERLMRKMRLSDRYSKDCGVFMAAVLQYLCAEVLTLAGEEAHVVKR